MEVGSSQQQRKGGAAVPGAPARSNTVKHAHQCNSTTRARTESQDPPKAMNTSSSCIKWSVVKAGRSFHMPGLVEPRRLSTSPTEASWATPTMSKRAASLCSGPVPDRKIECVNWRSPAQPQTVSSIRPAGGEDKEPRTRASHVSCGRDGAGHGGPGSRGEGAIIMFVRHPARPISSQSSCEPHLLMRLSLNAAGPVLAGGRRTSTRTRMRQP